MIMITEEVDIKPDVDELENKLSNLNYCCVFGCPNTNTTLAFFKLPDDVQKRCKWLELIHREELIDKDPSDYFVCEVHFRTEDVIESVAKKILKKNVLPALKLPINPKVDRCMQTLPCLTLEPKPQSYTVFTQTWPICPSQSTQTTASLIPSHPFCKKLKAELAEVKKELHSKKVSLVKKDVFVDLCDKHLSKDLSEIVKAQINLKQQHHGNRYTADYKLLCLKLFYTSPHAYKLLRSILHVPGPKALKTLSIPVTHEFTNDLLAIIKAKVDCMSELEKNCCVVLGTVKMKLSLFHNICNDKIIGFHEIDGLQSPDPANSALVLIVRGILADYSLPVSYALLSEKKDFDDVLTWINRVLAALFNIGLQVRTLVSDLESDWLTAAIRRTVSSSRPFFYLNDRKIYFIIDSPYLLKLLRNNLLKSDFHFQGHVAKIDHIQQFYEFDHQKSLKLAPALTESHLNPTKHQKRKTHFAAELLSKAVATGISTYVDFGAIDASGIGTASFINSINDLFDALNSAPKSEASNAQKPYRGDENQVRFFNEMLDLLQNLQLMDRDTGKDVSRQAYFIEEFQITIKSTMQLFEDLKAEGYDCLYTSRLQNVIFQKFIEQIRVNTSKVNKITSRQFVQQFKRVFFNNILRPNKKSNVAQSLEIIYPTYCNIRATRELAESSTSAGGLAADLPKKIQVAKTDYESLSTYEGKPIELSGHLLKLCVKRHSDCKILNTNLKLDQESYNFSGDEAYSVYNAMTKMKDLSSLPVIPPDDFIEYVVNMRKTFQMILENKHLPDKFCASICKDIIQIPNKILDMMCPCFPLTYLIKLYVRMKIFHMVKVNNKKFLKMRKSEQLTNSMEVELDEEVDF